MMAKNPYVEKNKKMKDRIEELEDKVASFDEADGKFKVVMADVDCFCLYCPMKDEAECPQCYL